MDVNLDGRRALVTGSTAGIGFAIARELVLLGATVAINGRTEARVGRAIAELERELPGRHFTLPPATWVPQMGSRRS